LTAFLHHTGIVSGIRLAPEDQDSHYFPLGHTLPLISEHAGLFVSDVPVGAWLQAGDPIGQIYDAFAGERRAELRAPVSGLLSGIRRLQTRGRVEGASGSVRGQEH
jgi:predicted deacylase